MDLNYLYHRHQVSLFMSDNARSKRARIAHGALAAAYLAKIEDSKRPWTEICHVERPQ